MPALEIPLNGAAPVLTYRKHNQVVCNLVFKAGCNAIKLAIQHCERRRLGWRGIRVTDHVDETDARLHRVDLNANAGRKAIAKIRIELRLEPIRSKTGIF